AAGGVRRAGGPRPAWPRSWPGHRGPRHPGASRGTAPGSRRAAGPLAVDLGAQLLAQPDLLGRDLDQLVVVDELQRLLQREAVRRDQAYVVVLAGGPDVGQLLAALCVGGEVVGLGGDARVLAIVVLPAGLD